MRPAVIAELAAVAADVPIQASGGIRSIDDAQALLEAGAARVIVGTAAFSTEDALAHFVDALDEQLVVAVDARDGMLRVGGWEADGELPVADAARRCATAGAVRIHCTAIDRDGRWPPRHRTASRGTRSERTSDHRSRRHSIV